MESKASEPLTNRAVALYLSARGSDLPARRHAQESRPLLKEGRCMSAIHPLFPNRFGDPSMTPLRVSAGVPPRVAMANSVGQRVPIGPSRIRQRFEGGLS